MWYNKARHEGMTMIPDDTTTQSRHIHRVDKFVVVTLVRDEFPDKARKTHCLLKTRQDFVLEQVAGSGEFNSVAMVQRDSQGSIENTKAAVASTFAQTNFNPKEN
ncbi:MAG: hypothetical protein WA632_14910 [Gallionella sp.]